MDAALAPHINALGAYLGARDVPALTGVAISAKYGFAQADVMLLFGGSILAGGDVFARAMKAGVARKYIIVGGAGHTTLALREVMRDRYPGWETDNLPESELFDGYIFREYGLRADALETESTNCGNNITFALKFLADAKSVILTQDATMQRRMAATLRKYRPDMTIINYASYQAVAIDKSGRAAFSDPPNGMWDMERYAALLMGEIPRLTDDENGYGPKGRGFIAHEDVPEAALAAYRAISEYDPSIARPAR